jgi:hypothetical protein
MDSNRFVRLSLLAFGLVLVSFVVLGFSRIVLPYRVARVLAAPTLLAGAGLVAYLFVTAVLAVLGVRPLEE